MHKKEAGEMSRDFINAIQMGNEKYCHEITVKFCGGKEGIYTTGILEMLKTDPSVIEIMDNETGEILHLKEA